MGRDEGGANATLLLPPPFYWLIGESCGLADRGGEGEQYGSIASGHTAWQTKAGWNLSPPHTHTRLKGPHFYIIKLCVTVLLIYVGRRS